jgi:hypothetical protein
VKNGLLSLLLLPLLAVPPRLRAQSAAFTYQGRLLVGGQPANGSYDFRFGLADALTDGSYLGPTLTNAPVLVSTGLFTVVLDFGGAVFNGAGRWLELAVRTNGSNGPYSVLSPRQPVTATPYAAYAQAAASAAVASNLVAGGAMLTNIPGMNIQAGTISSNQINAATDAAYRATDTNAVQAVGDQRWASQTVINVKDFGASGNGTTDDTAAISNAWAQFVAAGGTLYFPPGTYLDSATHSASGWRPGEPQHRDGRLILGQGSVIWKYTGAASHFVLADSVPDMEGIEFACGTQPATNCLYIAGPWSKWSMRNCFFNGWTNATFGALLIDDADSVTLSSVHFYQCRIGLGVGFHCGNLKGDLLASTCGIGVAVGVPTPHFPGERNSEALEFTLMSTYCGTSLAVDGGSWLITLRGFHWWAANGAVVLGQIPGVSTNYNGAASVTIDNNYFNYGSTIEPPIRLYCAVAPALNIVQSRFDLSGTNSVPIVKSYNSAGDATRIGWHDSFINGVSGSPMFEASTGQRLAESANDQSRFLNKGLGLYNAQPLTGRGGSGYVLDVLDSTFQNPSAPVARFGLASNADRAFGGFRGGLVVRYDATIDRAAVEVTNADFRIGGLSWTTGAGSPEGLIAAPVGSLYTRSDGGAGTTLYIKESGTGNTGWVAK